MKDVGSKDIDCGDNNRKLDKFVEVKGGDFVDFEWYYEHRGDIKKPTDTTKTSRLADTHKGPVTVYIALFSSDGEGPVWTKLAEDGYDSSTGEWASLKIIQNDGKNRVLIPPKLAPGEYILRTEMIALHEADDIYNGTRGAQFYPSCSQIKVTQGGNLSPPGTFDFVGGYKKDDPGIHFNIYQTKITEYPIPGPTVWSGEVDPAILSPIPTTTTKPTNTATTKPKNETKPTNTNTTTTTKPTGKAKPKSTTATTTTTPGSPSPTIQSTREDYRYSRKGKGRNRPCHSSLA